MPGMYSVQMLGMKYNRDMSDLRMALCDSGVWIDLNDCVDVDEAEKADKDIKKWFDEHDKERLAAKSQNIDSDEKKAAFLAEHNAKVEKALADAGSWEALVMASRPGAKSSVATEEE